MTETIAPPAAATAARRAPPAALDGSLLSQEFLSFKLGAEAYGVDILMVQEIRGYDAPTRMANVPAYIKGVVNLRGIIVPIVDLRMRFNLASVEYNEFTVVIILNIRGRVVGVVVDGVSDVITLQREQLKPAPGFCNELDDGHVMGLGVIDDRILILLDIERLMSTSDMGMVEDNSCH